MDNICEMAETDDVNKTSGLRVQYTARGCLSRNKRFGVWILRSQFKQSAPSSQGRATANIVGTL